MTVQRFVQLKQVVFSKTFKIWVKCCDSAFNLLFYLPCGGEIFFRRRCVEFTSLTARHRILDICCGTGDLTVMLAKKGSTGQVVGVDISKSALEIARAKTQHFPITFLRANANDLPFDSSRFDKCFISFGLHHMTEQGRQKTLTEIHRILTPEGALYVIDYNLPDRGLRRLVAIAYAKLDSSEEAYQMIRNGSLLRGVKQAGFEIKRRYLTCQGMVQLLEFI